MWSDHFITLKSRTLSFHLSKLSETPLFSIDLDARLESVACDETDANSLVVKLKDPEEEMLLWHSDSARQQAWMQALNGDTKSYVFDGDEFLSEDSETDDEFFQEHYVAEEPDRDSDAIILIAQFKLGVTFKEAFGRESASIVPPPPAPKPPEPTEAKIKELLTTLLKGEIFKKVKKGSGSKSDRRFFVAKSWDHFCWSEDEVAIKGSLYVQSIREINQGFGSRRDHIYIIGLHRSVEFKTGNEKTAARWKQALEMLVKFHRELREQRALLTATEGFKSMHGKMMPIVKSFLTTGSVFKKWPKQTLWSSVVPRNKEDAFTLRKLTASPDLTKLTWTDVANNKTKGSIDIEHIVQVLPDRKSPLRLSIMAVNRTLRLEGKDQTMATQWIKALRFLILENVTAAEKILNVEMPKVI